MGKGEEEEERTWACWQDERRCSCFYQLRARLLYPDGTLTRKLGTFWGQKRAREWGIFILENPSRQVGLWRHVRLRAKQQKLIYYSNGKIQEYVPLRNSYLQRNDKCLQCLLGRLYMNSSESISGNLGTSWYPHLRYENERHVLWKLRFL